MQVASLKCWSQIVLFCHQYYVTNMSVTRLNFGQPALIIALILCLNITMTIILADPCF